MTKTHYRFGDIIENGWASKNNPHRKGIFVRHNRNKIELTNGKGKFWEVVHDGQHKNKVIGRITDYENIMEVTK